MGIEIIAGILTAAAAATSITTGIAAATKDAPEPPDPKSGLDTKDLQKKSEQLRFQYLQKRAAQFGRDDTQNPGGAPVLKQSLGG